MESKYMNVNRLSSYIVPFFGNNRSWFLLLATLVIFPLFTIGCSDNSRSDVYFLAQKEPQTEYLTALLQGELVLDNGYLRVQSELVIWPYGYSFKQEKKEIWIINDKGQEVAREGDEVRIGGGEIPSSVVAQKISQKLPESIKGPFWLAGEISVIKQ